jgi:hypothetical protein
MGNNRGIIYLVTAGCDTLSRLQYEPAPESDDEGHDDIDDEEDFSDSRNENDSDLALRKRRRDEGDNPRKRPRIQEDGVRHCPLVALFP